MKLRIAALSAVVSLVFPAGAFAVAADARCAGSPVAISRIAGDGGARPSVRFDVAETAGRRSPSGAVLSGIALPATADDADRERLRSRIEAEAGSSALVYGDRVRLDRRDRVTGQVVVSAPGREAVWLQAAIVADGLAVVGDDAGACGAVLMDLERLARARRLGLFADTPDADDDGTRGAVGADLPAFVVLEGRVDSVGNSGRTSYLNLGRDRRSDATVRVSRRNSAEFPSEKSPSSLAGRLVRIRGWAFENGGPDLAVSDPGMIELIEERR